MATHELTVVICGTQAGTLCQDGAGLLSFCYGPSYDGVPLSLSMPISNRTYRDRVVRPFLFGLLPDGEQQRQAIAREYGVKPNNPFALLAHIGLDCPGGVQFCPPDNLGLLTQRASGYRPLSIGQVADRLTSIREENDVSWMGGEESWSLGGNQGKFALAWHEDAWCECLGSAPTTHIFKHGVVGFRLEALNEYVCMRTARLSGIPVADGTYQQFAQEPALIVRRFDRIADAGGSVVRLHQEDLCQALGVMPSQKYTSDGGPTTLDVLMLLASTNRAADNLYQFTRMLFFNCLIGAPDAHAKNYSILLGLCGEALLAPMYDTASGLAYERMRRKGRLAMSIGGENRFGRVGGGAIERFAGKDNEQVTACMSRAGLDAVACKQIMRELAMRIPHDLSQVFDESQELPGARELRERLEGPIAQNCAQTLALL